jgi:hypothetical protein
MQSRNNGSVQVNCRLDKLLEIRCNDVKLRKYHFPDESGHRGGPSLNKGRKKVTWRVVGRARLMTLALVNVDVKDVNVLHKYIY